MVSTGFSTRNEYVLNALLGTYRFCLIWDEVGLQPDSVDIDHAELEHAKLGSVPKFVTELSVGFDVVDVEKNVSSCGRSTACQHWLLTLARQGTRSPPVV